MPPKVFFGLIPDMIAEVGACDMGAEWFRECGYRYAVLADDGATAFGTSYFPTKRDAKSHAREWAAQISGRVVAV